MSSVQPTNFPRFLELPFELRWAVYELCLPARVIDEEIRVLSYVRVTGIVRKERWALRHLIAKFCRTPVIGRAIAEVYRSLRRHRVTPPDGQWAWSWFNKNIEGFVDPKPVLFDPKSDVLCILAEDVVFHCPSPRSMDKTLFHLTRNKDAVLAIHQKSIGVLKVSKEIAHQCYLGRKKCIIVLNETEVINTAKWITSCGLFGLFGEERTVLVDVDDLERIDYFDRKLNGEGAFQSENPWEYASTAPGGIRRYSSHSKVALHRTWHEGSPLTSDEERIQIVADDKKEVMRLIRKSWLEVNGCFDSRVLGDASIVPSSKGKYGRRDFDEEHPNAQPWYDKLPAFSFAVRVHAHAIEEYALPSEARKNSQAY